VLTYPLTDSAELRALEPWRAGEFQDFIAGYREDLAPWLPWAAALSDVDSTRQWLQRYADEQARDGGRIYGIWQDGVLVGGTLFRVFEPRVGACEIGVWLAPQARGQGLITLAAERMIGWAIGERGMNRVEWRAVPENTRSLAVARRLGMTREGVLREAFPYRGTIHDVEVWAILAREWRSR
jgi:ribosomal-protein-serine acetyltransferase